MTAVTKGFASRLGFALGRVLRFFLYDRNVVLRWVKRCFLISFLLMPIFIYSFRDVLGLFLTVSCLGLLVYTLVRKDMSILDLLSRRF